MSAVVWLCEYHVYTHTCLPLDVLCMYTVKMCISPINICSYIHCTWFLCGYMCTCPVPVHNMCMQYHVCVHCLFFSVLVCPLLVCIFCAYVHVHIRLSLTDSSSLHSLLQSAATFCGPSMAWSRRTCTSPSPCTKQRILPKHTGSWLFSRETNYTASSIPRYRVLWPKGN